MERNILNRTKFKFLLPGITIMLVGLIICAWPGVALTKTDTKKMIVLGFDGMDPHRVQEYIAEGLLPNFKKLAETGDFKPLATTIPPQSPVAWATFITGQDPGGTNIFDFIARDAATYMPSFSLAEVCPPKKEIKIPFLKWVVPVSKAEVISNRKGETFWEYLDEAKIPSAILRAPSNFPPVPSRARSLTGMGTPDILGAYGIFQFFTSKTGQAGTVQGGRVYEVEIENNVIKTEVQGPVNTFKEDRPVSKIPLTIQIDPQAAVARLKFADQDLILKEGAWSNWLAFNFKMSFSKAPGIGRFYLKQVRPDFQLYLSPINVDPREPPFAISSPEDYAKELAGKIGLFYTQGMPEDTNALNGGWLNEDEFLQQAELATEERLRMYRLELDRLKKEKTGLLFCYFSITDAIQHMFTGYMDPQFSGYTEESGEKYGRVIPEVYQKMDKVLGETMEKMDPGTTILILSDHGFTTFRRYFNLNTWLHKNGYMAFIDEYQGTCGELFENVDWKRTKAYALGLNGLYVNQKGREGQGIVNPGQEASTLLEKIRQGLLDYRDPKNEGQAVAYVDVPEKVYAGKYRGNAPDLIIGYNQGYRASWETVMGQAPEDIVGDNTAKWSGDHCIAGQLVPGIVLANKKIKVEDPAIIDLAPTILHEFGLDKPGDMTGRVIF